MYIHIHLYIHLHTYMYIPILRMECRPYQYPTYPYVQHLESSVQPGVGHLLYVPIDPMAQDPNCSVRAKPCGAISVCQPSRGTSSSVQYQTSGYPWGWPIHRLSAASLQRSLRARYRGLASEMAEDSRDSAFSFAGHAAACAAGAHSQILRRVSTLVEVTTQNWEHNYPGVLVWLPQEDDSHRYRQSRMLTVYLGNEDHLIDNRRFQRLRGRKRSLSHQIRLRRFRKLPHQVLDHIRGYL